MKYDEAKQKWESVLCRSMEISPRYTVSEKKQITSCFYSMLLFMYKGEKNKILIYTLIKSLQKDIQEANNRGY